MKLVKLKGVKLDFYVNPKYVTSVSVPEQNNIVLPGHALVTMLNGTTFLAAQSPSDVASLLSPGGIDLSRIGPN